MRVSVNADSIARTLAENIAEAWGQRLGRPAATGTPEGDTTGPGWLATAQASGVATGTVSVWFERDAVMAAVTEMAKLDQPPPADLVVEVLTSVVTQGLEQVDPKAGSGTLTFSGVTVTEANAPTGGGAYDITAGEMPVCRLITMASLKSSEAAVPATDRRLEAVLDVELPLVVRFGRAIMPLRALADLGPGSVVDMGRSPDDPVELLVGERLIARGEVVVVAGNYGVRITELIGARQSAGEAEGRA